VVDPQSSYPKTIKEMKLYCPLTATSVGCLYPPTKTGINNPPFSYEPNDAIKKIIEHIKRDHSINQIICFIEEYLAEEYLQSSPTTQIICFIEEYLAEEYLQSSPTTARKEE